MRPFIVFPEDKPKIAALRAAQGIPIQPILYKTDDGRGRYLIYRTTTTPNEWVDFHNADVKSLNSDFSAGYNDIILPNVDYYYFARFQDIHGNESNPTPIYHVRIVKEGGFPPYVITKLHTFYKGIPESEKRKYEKSFKKYIKIGLAPDTRSVKDDLNPELADLKYHRRGGSSSLKKYKVRITSKKTGKKFDINLDFAKKINKNYLNKDVVLDPEEAANKFIEQELTEQYNSNKEKKISQPIADGKKETQSKDDPLKNQEKNPIDGWQ
jgi:hypothetical protein